MEQSNEGIKLSFRSLLTTLPNKIEIPIIQRDYAQGRPKAVNIRNQFVNTLFDHLENLQPLHLDFIYGNVIKTNKKFIPLDGQQRLTTLFLLHWYLSLREDYFEDFREIVSNENGSRFTYETRQSSREFCDAIIKFPFKINYTSQVSSQLRDFNWYFQSWDKDPTVQSMLVMIDTIQQTYNEREASDLYPILIQDNEIITFQFIELANYGLTDDLYIKMNARGKPLTDFENFKAKFEKIVQELDNKEGSEFLKTFYEKIDKSWTDFMWSYRDRKTNTYDNAFMNLIGTIFSISLSTKDDVDINSIKYLMGRNPNPKFDYYELNNRGSFQKEHIERFFSYMNNIEEKGVMLKHLPNDDIFSITAFLEDTFEYSNRLSYSKRIQFYALLEYLKLKKNPSQLAPWMRVIRNLSENTFFREAPEFVNGIQSVNELLPFAEDILKFLQEGRDIKAFENIQKNEEYVKATLISKGDHWASLIYEIENHKYFEGQIGFLLDFTGINEYAEKDGHLNWSEEIDEHLFELFTKYTKLSQNIFDENGIRHFDKFLFRRALLTFGDFTLPKGSNWSFVTNGTSREISWKALLKKDWKQRDVFGEFFEELNENENIERQLEEFIFNSQVEDWRKGFIEYSEILNCCGNNYYIRFIDEEDILLLSKNQTNGLHREYFSFHLDCELNKIGALTEYQTANAVDEYKGIKKVSGKSCKIQWLRWHDEPCFLIKYDNEEYFIDTIEDCINKLKELELIIE
jgi:hypothetical protein